MPGLPAGVIDSDWNIRDCQIESDDKVAQLEAMKHGDPSGYLVEGRSPFVVKTVQGRLLCYADDDVSKSMWLAGLLDIGNAPGMRKLDVGLRTTQPPPSPGITLEVIVERGRHLNMTPETCEISQMDNFLGYFCIVQLRDAKAMTRVVNDVDVPRWAETFEMSVTDPDSDLVTVQLWQTMAGGEEVAVGHVAVPAERVRATSTEEGWYEVRARDGTLVMGATGKTSLLIRFRYLEMKNFSSSNNMKSYSSEYPT